MYHTISELLKLAEDQDTELWVPILQNECRMFSYSQEQVFEKMEMRYQIMERSAHKALDTPLKTVGGLIEGVSSAQNAYTNTNNTISGNFINKLMARALSSSEVNASMGKICAAPTAGSCGILPAVLITLGEDLNLERRKIIEGLITATGIGAVITMNATVSGAEGGCQAECGVAAAMAAAAAVQMKGGSNEAAVNSVCFALMNCMGLICDPVAGLVQVPCAQRNASQAVNAVISADLALSGMKSIIPADEVIDAMYKVGKMLPVQLRETAQGGIAATPSGESIKREIFK